MLNILIAIYMALFAGIGLAIHIYVEPSGLFVWFMQTSIWFLLALLPFSIVISPVIGLLSLFKE